MTGNEYTVRSRGRDNLCRRVERHLDLSSDQHGHRATTPFKGQHDCVVPILIRCRVGFTSHAMAPNAASTAAASTGATASAPFRVHSPNVVRALA